MADLTPIKLKITREECRLTQVMQEREDFFILEFLAGDVVPNLSYWNPPTPQALPLTFDDVFVQDIHATVEATTNSSACLRSALRRKVHGFRNGFVRDTPVPFLDNGLPIESTGDLLQHIAHEDPRAATRRLAMTHLWIHNDESPKDFHGLCCLHLSYSFNAVPTKWYPRPGAHAA